MRRIVGTICLLGSLPLYGLALIYAPAVWVFVGAAALGTLLLTSDT